MCLLNCHVISLDGEEIARCFASWCLVSVVLLFLTMPQICLQFVIVVFPDHTHYVVWSWTAVWMDR